MLRLVLLSVLALAACASSHPRTRSLTLPEDTEGQQGGEFKRERRIEIAAGKVVEINIDVPASTVVAAMPIEPLEVVFEASVPLSWNVHLHMGSEPGEDEENIEVLVEGNDASGIIRHTPSRPGVVSVIWENDGDAPVSATIRVDKMPAGSKGGWFAD